jgi:hypothetical protein
MMTVLLDDGNASLRQNPSKDVDFVIGSVTEIGEVVRHLTLGETRFFPPT